MSVLHASDTSFEKDVLKADKPVVVDFWAEWCGPCKMIAPYLDDIAAELGDRVRIVKINIDENPLTPTKYGVRGIPTLMIGATGGNYHAPDEWVSLFQLEALTAALMNTAQAFCA